MHKYWLAVATSQLLEMATHIGLLGGHEMGDAAPPRHATTTARRPARDVGLEARTRRDHLDRNFINLNANLFGTKQDAIDFVTEYARLHPDMKWVIFEASMFMEVPIVEPITKVWGETGELV